MRAAWSKKGVHRNGGIKRKFVTGVVYEQEEVYTVIGIEGFVWFVLCTILGEKGLWKSYDTWFGETNDKRKRKKEKKKGCDRDVTNTIIIALTEYAVQVFFNG